MALVKCDGCGKEISDSAKKCPHCGIDTKEKDNSNSEKYDFYFIISLLLIIIVGILALKHYSFFKVVISYFKEGSLVLGVHSIMYFFVKVFEILLLCFLYGFKKTGKKAFSNFSLISLICFIGFNYYMNCLDTNGFDFSLVIDAIKYSSNEVLIAIMTYSLVMCSSKKKEGNK